MLPALRALLMLAACLSSPIVAAQVPLTQDHIGGGPRVVAVNPLNNKVYIAQHGASNVHVINVATGATHDIGLFFGPPTSLAVDPASGIVYVGGEGMSAFLDGNNNDALVQNNLGAAQIFNGPPFGTNVAVTLAAGAVNPASHLAFFTDPANGDTYPNSTSGVFPPLPFGMYPCSGPLAVNPATGFIFVSDSCNGAIRAFTDASQGSAFTFISVGGNPTALAVNPVTNKVYVALAGTSGVAVIDGQTNVVTPLTTGFTSPTAVAVNPVTNKIYVANLNNVVEIDGATNTVTPIAVGFAANPNPLGISVDNTRNRIYVANHDDKSLSVINGASRAVVNVHLGTMTPNSVAVNPLATRVYLVDETNGFLETVDGRTFAAQTSPLSLANTTVAVVDPMRDRGFFNDGSSNVTVITRTSQAVAATVNVGAAVSFMALDPASGRLFAAKADATVAVIATDNTITTTLTINDTPLAMAANPATHTVYVASHFGNVQAIDANALTVGGIRTTGPSPTGIAVDAAHNRFFVADALNGNLVFPSTGGSITLNGSTSSAVTAVAANPATGRGYLVHATVIDEFDGSNGQRITSYPFTNAPTDIAVNSITNHVYVTDGTTSLHVIDPVAGTELTPITLPNAGSKVSIDELANRVYVTTATSIVTIDGESGSITSNAGAPGTPAKPVIDSVLHQAWLPMPSAAHPMVVRALDPVTTPNELLPHPALPGVSGIVTSNPSPTFLPITVSGNYAPNDPGGIVLHSSVDDLYGTTLAATNNSGAYALNAAGPLATGLHYLTAFATDNMSGTVTNSQAGAGGANGGLSFFIGSPRTIAFIVVNPPAITTGSPMTGGTEGIAYSQAVTASGGTGGYTFTLTGGALPDGLAIASDGTISGTPTLAGTYNFTVTVTDDSGGSNSAPLALTIAAGAPSVTASPVGGFLGVTLFTTVTSPLTVTNVGWGTAQVSSVVLTPIMGGTFTIASDGCTGIANLTHGQSCTIVVSFRPITTTPISWTLRITSNDAVNPIATVGLSGSGLLPPTVSAAITGTGSGTITGTGINCPGTCLSTYPDGTVVVLTATPSAGSVFVQWSGCDTVTDNQCTVTVLHATSSVTATFTALVTYNIVLEGYQEVSPYVQTAATGGGTAVFNPVTGQLSFNISYSGLVDQNGQPALEIDTHIYSAARGANGTATIPMSSGTTKTDPIHLSPQQQLDLGNGLLYVNIETAAHPNGELRGQIDNLGAAPTHTLTVVEAGTGAGVVGGLSEAGAILTCPSQCSATVPVGKTVSLLPLSALGSRFVGWSGACTGSSDCQVTMNADQSVTVTFDLTPPGLAVTPLFLDFGGESMGTTSPSQPVTVTNNGLVTVNISSIVIDAPFTQTNDCGTTLAVGTSCTVTVTFNPAAADGAINSTLPASGGLTITSDAAGSPHRVILNGSAEKSLVTHYYRSILRRDPDAGGKTFWQGEAARAVTLGIDVNETWYAMALQFYRSPEYLAFNRDDTGFVTDLYNTFFNRTPDGPGLTYWTGQISGGMPRDVVLVSFMFSPEFVNFTQAIFGNTGVRAEINTVIDFYRGTLARLPDNDGFAFWLQQLRAAQCQGSSAIYTYVDSLSSLFLGSPEYVALGRTNAGYVGDLYDTFLRRGADLGGVNFWIQQLDTGAQTREQLRKAFIASPEFSARVNAVVDQGCLH
jgi:DNA-binding beta-propeller fold protein YncE